MQTVSASEKHLGCFPCAPCLGRLQSISKLLVCCLLRNQGAHWAMRLLRLGRAPGSHSRWVEWEEMPAPRLPSQRPLVAGEGGPGALALTEGFQGLHAEPSTHPCVTGFPSCSPRAENHGQILSVSDASLPWPRSRQGCLQVEVQNRTRASRQGGRLSGQPAGTGLVLAQSPFRLPEEQLVLGDPRRTYPLPHGLGAAWGLLRGHLQGPTQGSGAQGWVSRHRVLCPSPRQGEPQDTIGGLCCLPWALPLAADTRTPAP